MQFIRTGVWLQGLINGNGKKVLTDEKRVVVVHPELIRRLSRSREKDQ